MLENELKVKIREELEMELKDEVRKKNWRNLSTVSKKIKYR